MAPNDDLTSPEFLNEITESLQGVDLNQGHPETAKDLIAIITSDAGVPEFLQSSMVNGFHYLNLRKLAENSDGQSKLSAVTTRFEKRVLDDAVEMMGYDASWKAQFDQMFENLKSSDWRKDNSEFIFNNYMDFLRFANLMVALRKELKDAGKIDDIHSPDDRELLRKIQTFYYIIDRSQASELTLLARTMSKKSAPSIPNGAYKRQLPKSPETDIILMNLLHDIYSDKVFSPHEQTLFDLFVHYKLGYNAADLPFLHNRLVGKLKQQHIMLKEMLNAGDRGNVTIRSSLVHDASNLTEIEDMVKRITMFEKHLRERYALPHAEEMQLRDYIGKYIAGIIVGYDQLVKRYDKPYKVLTLCGPFEDKFLDGLTNEKGLNLKDVAVVPAEDREDFRYRMEANPAVIVLSSIIPGDKMGGTEGTYDGRSLVSYARSKAPGAKIVLLDKLGGILKTDPCDVDLSLTMTDRMGDKGLERIKQLLYTPTNRGE